MRFVYFLTVLFAIIVFNIVATPTDAQTTSATFTKNLTLGSTGAEVVSLQQVLVVGGYLVMPAGVSFGYFGSLTHRAVASWQRANGVAPAAGYWGPISRERYRVLSNTSFSITSPTVNTPTTPETDISYIPGVRINKIILFSVYPFEVRPDDIIVLSGSGFSKTSNRVYFNGRNETKVASTNGNSLQVSVPTGLNEGEYKITVSNLLGSSENPDIGVVIKVTNNPQPTPKIDSVSLSGDAVTIMGSGFTFSNNLLTTLGNSSSPVSSSGTTITFRLGDLSSYEEIKKYTQGKYQVSLWIYVQNEHGINKDPYELKLTI